jgi:hypothetical protein
MNYDDKWVKGADICNIQPYSTKKGLGDSSSYEDKTRKPDICCMHASTVQTSYYVLKQLSLSFLLLISSKTICKAV